MKNFFTTLLWAAFCVVLFSHAASAQDSLFRLDKTIEYPIASFTVNNLGELYVINTNNQLKKLTENGDSVGVFNMVTKYGKLSYVEVQNPWKAILYYKNFSTVVLLDKYLNVVTSINLRKQNIFKVNAVTTSYDNNMWLYDEQDGKLKKIDDAGKILLETVDFRLLFDSVPSPVKILDRDGFVYLYDPNKGMYVFDYYGAFKNKLTFLNWKDFTVNNKTIYGFDEKFFYSYATNSLNLNQFEMPVNFRNYSSLIIGINKLYLLKNNSLQIYSFK